MAKRYKNDKGFLIIEMTFLEAANDCNFGTRLTRFVSRIICDNCGTEISGFDDVYYVAAINRVLCKKCLEDFIIKFDRHEDDIPFEQRHFDYYAKLLNFEEEL